MDIQEPYIISCLANRGPPCVQLQNHLHVFIDHIGLKQRMLGNTMSCTQPVRVWTMASTSSTQYESTLFYVSAIYMHDNWAMKLQPLSCPSFRQTYIYSHPLLHNSSIKGLWSLTSCMSYLKGNVNSHPTLPPLLKGITGNIVLQQSDFRLLYYTRDDQSFMDRATSHPHDFETISKTGDIIKTLTYPGKTLTVGNLKYLSGMKKDISVYFVYKLMTLIASVSFTFCSCISS